MKLSKLSAVTEAVFQREYQKLRPVLDTEARILHQLAKLDTQVSEVRADCHQTEGYRVTGSDVLWRGWESAARRQLNIELARVRAQKIAAMEDLKRAFGKKQAVCDLEKTQQRELRHRQHLKLRE